ncbi:MAG: NAD(P)-dependent oxidoreductase, partial [Alphaproteobacteria bacterium]|nr:NAD(P)-dependent oxidoreductase [Alphaproteobacteria bacterium]
MNADTGAKKTLLIYDKAWARLKDRIAEKGWPIEPLLLHDDERLIDANGNDVAVEDAEFEIAWASKDTYVGGPARRFFKLLFVCDTLKWFQSSAAGFDHPIFADVAKKGVIMTRSDAQSVPIAEFVFGRLFDVFHPNRERDDAQHRHAWDRFDFRDISGTTWLVIGMGAIGRAITTRAKAFEAHVIGMRRTPTGDEPADEMITPDQLQDAIPRADVIVLSAPATPETENMVDAEFLSRVKQGAVLINIARGTLVDEEALRDALDAERLDAAILDVFVEEPLPQ